MPFEEWLNVDGQPVCQCSFIRLQFQQITVVLVYVPNSEVNVTEEILPIQLLHHSVVTWVVWRGNLDTLNLGSFT